MDLRCLDTALARTGHRLDPVQHPPSANIGDDFLGLGELETAMNTEDIIVMVIFYVFAFYALMLFIMSIRRGEILFEQGKGTRVSDGASFIRWLIYHGTIIGILLLVLFVVGVIDLQWL